MQSLISIATKRNWDKLHPETNGNLMSRANKRLSQKTIIPVEYITKLEHLEKIVKILDVCSNCHWNNSEILYSLGINLLSKAGILDCSHVKSVLEQYNYRIIPDLLEYYLPQEFDLLGLLYQCLLHEGEKNVIGSYYTPYQVAANMTADLDFSKRQIFLDPCCGSGAFFLVLDAPDPELLYGIDCDPIAVMIARINLMLKYPDRVFTPQIFCQDYLSPSSHLKDEKTFLLHDFQVDYIITNPPWGAFSENGHFAPVITSKETFSCFFVRSWPLLKDEGSIRFLFPEAILKVKVHRDIRTFMLDHCSLRSITIYEKMFSGVTTKYVDIHCQKTVPREIFEVHKANKKFDITLNSLRETNNNVFNLLENEDLEIIHRIKSCGKFDLRDSIWALGIVTGDNKSKLKNVYSEGYEPIYTGKEIEPFRLRSANKFIRYDRIQFQQAAKDEIYRAPEKLVYKFISDKLIFAFDNEQRLFINSANILIPHIPGMSIKTVLAFLNSDLYQYLYLCLFGEIKILKGNLLELPFPAITRRENEDIERSVDTILSGNTETIPVLQQMIYRVFKLKRNQIHHIGTVLNR